MRTVIFLHAVPQGPEAWTSQIDALPEGFTGRALPLLGTRDAHSVDFRVDRAVAAILSELDDAGLDRVDLCGLSVGAMVATRTPPARTPLRRRRKREPHSSSGSRATRSTCPARSSEE